MKNLKALFIILLISIGFIANAQQTSSGGIVVPTGLKVTSAQPVDDRMVVVDSLSLISIPNKYEGLQSYSVADSTMFVYNGTTWNRATSSANGVISNIPAYLPPNFYVATSQDPGTEITYRTDTFRQFDLQAAVGEDITIINSNEVLRNGNDLFIIGNFVNSSTPAIIVSLLDCKIVDNKLVPGSVTSATLTVSMVHGTKFHRGFIYATTRVGDYTTPTSILKINPYNFTDYKVLTFPYSGDTAGYTTDIQCYRDRLYILMSTGGSTAESKLIGIDEDLLSYSTILSYGSNTNKRVARLSPFLIHNEEIYIPNYTRVAGRVNEIGVGVFSLDGDLKREVSERLINNPTNTTTYPMFHWATIFNGKLILASTSNKFIARFDCRTLDLEESIPLNKDITDDNSTDRDGYIYLQEEITDNQVLKIKYNDFTDYSIAIESFNDGSGALEIVPIEKEIVKTRLSQFKNDLTPVSSTLPGIVNNTSLQELGGTDKIINFVRIGRGGSTDGLGANSSTVVGNRALFSNTSGVSNTAIGSYSMYYSITGKNNTSIGAGAMQNFVGGGTPTTSDSNTAIGAFSMYSATSGYQNTGIGQYALRRVAGGAFNVAIGVNPLQKVTTGSSNLGFGVNVGYNITTGSDNILFSTNSTVSDLLVTGSGNTIIGAEAPSDVSDNVIIGANSIIAIRKLSDNTLLAPTQTNTLITADATGKSIVTKEYFNANAVTQSQLTTELNGVVKLTGTEVGKPITGAIESVVPLTDSENIHFTTDLSNSSKIQINTSDDGTSYLLAEAYEGPKTKLDYTGINFIDGASHSNLSYTGLSLNSGQLLSGFTPDNFNKTLVLEGDVSGVGINAFRGLVSNVFINKNGNLNAFAQLGDIINLGETSTTSYRGDRGKIAYDHSQLTSGNPHATTLANVTASGATTTTPVGFGYAPSASYSVTAAQTGGGGTGAFRATDGSGVAFVQMRAGVGIQNDIYTSLGTTATLTGNTNTTISVGNVNTGTIFIGNTSGQSATATNAKTFINLRPAVIPFAGTTVPSWNINHTTSTVNLLGQSGNTVVRGYFVDPTLSNFSTGHYFRAFESTHGGGYFNTSSPDNSAVLQADSTTQGSLPFPRMTAANKAAIASPGLGLHIYQTDGTEGVYVYKSTGWTFAY